MGGCCNVSVPAILATCFLSIGWAFNIAAIFTCRFVETGGFQDEQDNTFVAAFGLYTFQGTNQFGQPYCYVIEYTSLTQNLQFWKDNDMNTARICGGIGAFIAFCLMIFCWFGACCGCLKVKALRFVISFFSFCCFALAGCMFYVNRSSLCNEHGCSFALGGGLVIGAMLAYFAAALLICVAPDKDDGDSKGAASSPPPQAADATAVPAAAATAAPGTVTIEKIEQADGTVVTKKTTVNQDGSQTVEETTEAPLYDAKV